MYVLLVPVWLEPARVVSPDGITSVGAPPPVYWRMWLTSSTPGVLEVNHILQYTGGGAPTEVIPSGDTTRAGSSQTGTNNTYIYTSDNNTPKAAIGSTLGGVTWTDSGGANDVFLPFIVRSE